MKDLWDKAKGWLIAGIVLAALVAAFYFWTQLQTKTAIADKALAQLAKVNDPQPAKQAPQLSGAPKVDTKLATCTVQSYTPPAATRAHLLPKPIADSPKQVIVASSRIEPDDHPETITATIDTDTGQAVQSVVREPLPWRAKDTRREASLDLLEKFAGSAVRIQARQDLFQVKAVHFHMMAGADMPVPLFGMAGRPDAFIGVGLHVALP